MTKAGRIFGAWMMACGCLVLVLHAVGCESHSSSSRRSIVTGSPATITHQTKVAAMPNAHNNGSENQFQGLWLQPNRDAQNTSRADLPANMSGLPKEVWRFGAEAFSPSAIRPIDIASERCLLVQRGWRMQMFRADGSSVWPQPIIGPSQVLAIWHAPSGARILARWGQSGVILLDAKTGSVLWRRMFDQGFVGAITSQAASGFRLFIAPANSTVCMCFQWDNAVSGEPRLLWEQNYDGRYLANFGPLLALGDMDSDGRDELVLVSKPAYVGVIDCDTGKIKFDLQYAITGGDEYVGRPYGVVQLVDLDGDGFLDVFVAGYRVEEYYAVVKNEAGKRLRAVWSRFVEKDFPEDHRELHPTATSIADVNGDGKPEIIVGLFNMTGDQRWHTLVLDPLKGDTAPLHDWPDRYFWGCFSLGDNGRAQVIVSETHQRSATGAARLEARDGASGIVVAQIESAELATRMVESGTPTPHKGAHYAEHREPIFMRSPAGKPGLLLQGDDPDHPRLWSLRDGPSQIDDIAMTRVSRKIVDGASDMAGPISVPLDLHIRGVEESSGPAALAALVGQIGNHRELVIWQSDNTIVGGIPDLSHSGQLRNRWRVPGIQPSLWLSPEGRRVLCAIHPTDDAVLIYETPGKQPSIRIDLPLPPQRRLGERGIYQSALVPFTIGSEMRLLVSLVTGRDTVALALYDGKGKLLWLDREHGTCPHPPAVYDLDGNGVPELLLDDHGRQAIYQLDGSAKLFAQAWHDTVPGRDNGTAHALPIVGPFGPGGAVRMVMGPGFSAFEVCDAAGNRLAQRKFAGHYDYYLSHPSIARRGNDQWDLGVIHRIGILEWIDTANVQTRASLNLGQPLLPGTLVIACDLDGDGRDEFIIGLTTGQLLAVGETNGKSRILWRLDLRAEIIDLIAADVDGDRSCELLVTTGDGIMRVMR